MMPDDAELAAALNRIYDAAHGQTLAGHEVGIAGSLLIVLAPGGCGFNITAPCNEQARVLLQSMAQAVVDHLDRQAAAAERSVFEEPAGHG